MNTDTPPEEMRESTSPITDPDPEEKQLREVLKNLISEHVQDSISPEKVYQYAEARKNELYWRGNQYIYPVLRGGLVVDWASNGDLNYNTSNEEREAQYDYVLNIMRGDGQKFIAVLGQREPNVKAMPRRQDDESAVRRARKADTAAAYLQSIWVPDRVQRHLALSLWKNGTTFAYTPWVVNADVYGQTGLPQMDLVDMPVGEPYYKCMFCGTDTLASIAGQPPKCSNTVCGQPLDPGMLTQPGTVPTPVASGMKYYPRGSVELHLATIFEVTTPFWVHGVKDTPWLWYEYEESKGTLLKAWPELRQKLGTEEWAGDSGEGTSAQGQLARDIASSPTGTYIVPRKDRWLYQRFWLTPAMFELVNSASLRAKLTEKYPEGVRVSLVQSEVIELFAERLDTVWAMCKPSTSEYIFADPICKDYLSIQDIVNDMYNIVVETMERAIPYVMADPLVLDVVQMSKQRGRPSQIIPAKAGVGARLQDSVFKAPVATVEPQMISWMNMVHEKGREIVGVIPAIFGGEGPTPTARQAELQRNQALQQLNPVWNEMRDFWAQVYLNGVRQLAKHSLPDGSNLGQSDGGQFEDGEADFTDLLSGGWFFETDEAMPMTWGAQRDQVMYLLSLGPEAWQLFGLQHPLNISKLQEAFGLTDWKVTDMDARDKVLATIQLLKHGQPMPPPMPGGPPAPSIPPDVFEDDHMLVATVIKEWAQTEEGRTLKDNNPAGYSNIMAYGMASLQLSGPPPMAPQGPPPAGAGPGPNQPPPNGQPPAGVAGPAPPGASMLPPGPPGSAPPPSQQ